MGGSSRPCAAQSHPISRIWSKTFHLIHLWAFWDLLCTDTGRKRYCGLTLGCKKSQWSPWIPFGVPQMRFWMCMKPRVQLYRNFHWWSTKWVLCQNEASKLLSRFLPSNNLTNPSCNSRKIPFEEQNPSFTWQTLFHSKSKISDFIGKLFWKAHYWATFTFFLFCTLFETTRDHKIKLLAIFRG